MQNNSRNTPSPVRAAVFKGNAIRIKKAAQRSPNLSDEITANDFPVPVNRTSKSGTRSLDRIVENQHGKMNGNSLEILTETPEKCKNYESLTGNNTDVLNATSDAEPGIVSP